MTDTPLHLGEPADEADWRALVEQGLKGASWDRLVGKTADGLALQPLYRESDMATADDVSGMPGAAPFVRGARACGWTVRQAYEHPDPVQTNDEILADLAGGVGAIELVVDPTGMRGVAIREPRDLEIVLSNVIVDIAPVSLDASAAMARLTLPDMIDMLGAKTSGGNERGVGFNLDPIGRMMRFGEKMPDRKDFARVVSFLFETSPETRVIRMDARAVHEAGGTEAQEIATALCSGIEYLRWMDKELNVNDTTSVMSFAMAVGPDVLVETAKLRALRLCWARVTEASKAKPEYRAAPVHAFTSRRMMTRHDAQTNILRVTTAAFAAAIGGADDITTYPFTDALGLPTPFARRVARNTQHVLLEECRLGHVADPAGGAWFVEKLTRDLAARAWEIMQEIESQGGIVAALESGWLQTQVAAARAARQKRIATRRETITGVTDFPLLGAALPETMDRRRPRRQTPGSAGEDAGGPYFTPIRWAEPFEALRDRAEATHARVVFANLGHLAEFGPRAQWARNLLASGGVAAIGPEDGHAAMDALIDAFRASGVRVALIAGADATYAEHAVNCAQRLKAAGADWVALAGKPGESEAKLRAAGIDQFMHAGQDALAELATLHAALGVG